MPVTKQDMEILASDEMLKMKDQYYEKFGEDFPCFNYVDFPGTKEQIAAEMYLEILKTALKGSKPYHFISRQHDQFARYFRCGE